ncbi:spore germination protein GerW family protein [Streptomyces sp. NBC_00083]|uniref:spore germination protein GerW family protein n=1 Tax=Streptomyces sp. NBC_00083 TaxID=2975647 RepID=UPI0022549205|nr:spore germination protein GerW family protein [Streptomyces sp. NBC_00083]MCX5387823.1 sporulation protein [Streptomyces sp. NBC_00083]
MTSSAVPDQPAPQDDPAAALMDRLAGRIGGGASASAVFGAPVTAHGITVVPVAEIAFGFAGATGSGTGAGVGGGAAGTGHGGGGAGARPCGFIEIKDGTATYRSLPAPWTRVAVPLAALAAGTVVPLLVRRLAGRRGR